MNRPTARYTAAPPRGKGQRAKGAAGPGLILLCLLALLAPRAAQAQEVAATLTADLPETITVGDPVRLLLEVRHPAGTVAILPDLRGPWGDLEVRSQEPPETARDESGALRTRQIIEVVAFAPGSFTTPGLVVAVSDRSGALLETAAAPVARAVTSVLTSSATGTETPLRELKPQAGLRAGVLTAYTAAGALLLALALAGGFWLWRRARARGFLRRTPLQRALDELDAVAAANYPAQKRYKELYLAVSHTVRRHAEQEFGVELHERTTTEMRSILRRVALPQEVSRRLLTLFLESDLVKFAQVTPTPESAAALLAEARALVRAVADARAADARAAAGPSAVSPAAQR